MATCRVGLAFICVCFYENCQLLLCLKSGISILCNGFFLLRQKNKNKNVTHCIQQVQYKALRPSFVRIRFAEIGCTTLVFPNLKLEIVHNNSEGWV